MTKSAHRLLKTRVVSSLGAATLLALGTLLACGNDDIPVEGGAGASNAHAGASHTAGAAGKAAEAEAGASGSGEAGSAGEDGSPENTGGSAHGGMSQGGSSGTGTGGGTPGAGTGGAGVTVGCGNGVVDPGEQCDDGNTKFGDSCSPTCTNTCETCEKDSCGPSDNLAGDYDHCYGAGFPGAQLATDGPAAGKAKTKLCQAVVECVKRTQCNANAPLDKLFKNCYCGTAGAVDCQTAPLGACQEQMAGAGESQEFNRLSQRANSPQYALGVADILLAVCDTSYCGPECNLDKPKTACQSCSVQQDAVCDMATCYFEPANSALCAPVVDCALSSGCAATDWKNCYTGAAPCLAEFKAGTKSTDVAGIAAALSTLGGVMQIAKDLLDCDRSECNDACFPVANGGGGSGGAASGAGGAPGGTGGASAGSGG